MTDEVPVVRKLYEIKSILKTDPPPGAEGSDWYRYEIAHGTNSICGYTQGSLEEVREAMDENVVQLNERQFGKRAMASKKKEDAKTDSSTENKTDS
ncbi:MAG: hypothetical protein ACRBDX_03685 [Gammaproteobacteria bacterium]